MASSHCLDVWLRHQGRKRGRRLKERRGVVPLPPNGSDYSRIVEAIGPVIQRQSPAPILLAESFSGPLAIELAARYEIAALILCNSFASLRIHESSDR